MTERGRLLTVALLGLLLAGPLGAATVTYGDLEISSYNEPRGQTAHGYIDYRVQVRHKGEKDNRVVRLALPADEEGGRGGRIREVSRQVTVAPGRSVVV